jgi:phosphoglycolate phosphatase
VSLIGDGIQALIDRAVAANGVDLSPRERSGLYARFLALYSSMPVRHTKLYDGVRDTLDELRSHGFLLGICTNKERELAVAILRGLDLDIFDVIVGGACTSTSKPEPEPLQACLDQLDVLGRDACMVGDGLNDVLVAQRVGIPCIALTYGYGDLDARRLGADAVIDSIRELPGTLARLDRRHTGTCPGDAEGPG